MTETLAFRIHKVRCTDETGGKFQEKIGSDDIFLAAVAVHANNNVEIIPSFHVGQFKDKKERVFNPPKPIIIFDLSKGGNFPQGYVVKIVLIERDEGKGIDKFLKKLALEIKEKIRKAEAGILDASSDKADGGAAVAASIGIAVAKEAGKEMWKKAREDDIFPPHNAIVKIPRANFRWPNGAKNSPREIAMFEAHKGKYSIRYDWLISN
jgi:hypothetical protein